MLVCVCRFPPPQVLRFLFLLKPKGEVDQLFRVFSETWRVKESSRCQVLNFPPFSERRFLHMNTEQSARGYGGGGEKRRTSLAHIKTWPRLPQSFVFIFIFIFFS